MAGAGTTRTTNLDDEPWYILSDLPADHRALAAYAVRFHIEEMFRDFKEFGFRRETTHLKDPERVSRLLLCVCLAHVWLLSYFQIGWRYLQQQWSRGLPLRCKLAAYI